MPAIRIMRAIQIDGWTSPDRLRVAMVPRPVCGADEVLVRAEAVPVSHALSLLIQGRYQRRPPLPLVPGNTVAGTVIESGMAVRRFRPGDRVVASVEFGGLAELVAAPEVNTYAIPDPMPLAEATALNTSYNSVVAALSWPRLLDLRPGQTLLVTGAAGNVGTAAVEVAKALGARVVAVVSDERKRDWALSHGADAAIAVANPGGLRDAVFDVLDGRPADAFLDPVGGDVLLQGLRCVRPEGRVLPIGFAGGAVPAIPANLVLVKNLTICGFYMGFYKIDQRLRYEAEVRRIFDRLGDWYCQKAIQPRVTARFPLERVAEAFAAVGERSRLGHVVVEPGLPPA